MAGSLALAGLYLVAERVFVLFTELFGSACTATALTPDVGERLADADADAARAAGIGWFTGDEGNFVPAALAASVFATMGFVLSVAFFCGGAFFAAAGCFTTADFFGIATFVTLFLAAAAFLAGADFTMAFLPGGLLGTTLFATGWGAGDFFAAGFLEGTGFAAIFFFAAGLALGVLAADLPADLAAAGAAFLAVLALADFPLELPI